MRCTVLGSTPKRLAIFRTPSVRSGAFSVARIRASTRFKKPRFFKRSPANFSEGFSVQFGARGVRFCCDISVTAADNRQGVVTGYLRRAAGITCTKGESI